MLARYRRSLESSSQTRPGSAIAHWPERLSIQSRRDDARDAVWCVLEEEKCHASCDPLIPPPVPEGRRGHGGGRCAPGVDVREGCARDHRSPTASVPQALQGLQLGDPGDGSVVVWSRSDRAARMLVDWSYDEQFKEARRIVGPHALETTDFTARQALAGLEAGSDVFVRVSFQSLNNVARDRRAGDRTLHRAARSA